MAEAGIPEVWLVDLAGGRMEVHRDPTLDGYQKVQTFYRGQSVVPQALPDLALPLNDVLG
jgi:Uma2 family endonuclease